VCMEVRGVTTRLSCHEWTTCEPVAWIKVATLTGSQGGGDGESGITSMTRILPSVASATSRWVSFTTAAIFGGQTSVQD
jgi:hypothetical protein